MGRLDNVLLYEALQVITQGCGEAELADVL